MAKKHPASKWRALAQDIRGNKVRIECEGTEFDELVFHLPGNQVFHVERMSESSWFVGIGEQKLIFTATAKGIRIGEWYR